MDRSSQARSQVVLAYIALPAALISRLFRLTQAPHLQMSSLNWEGSSYDFIAPSLAIWFSNKPFFLSKE